MKIRKSRKYKNYGPIPQNEYANASTGKSADVAAVLEYDPQPDDTAYKQRLAKRQTLHPSGRRKTGGWARLWKVNGWRNESASLDDEYTDMESYPGYARKSSRPL